jgi:carbonic anhydrase
MQKLTEGLHKFKEDEWGKYQELFYRLSKEGQHPHTLFITCSDSRVIAELITQSQPGDLFVVKNIGNIVPSFNVTGSSNSTAAAIEFAVESLLVKDIVVCGHSLCGAMSALVEGIPESQSMPHLRQWLELASPVRKIINENYNHLTDPIEKTTAAALENVLHSLGNLHSYPMVEKRLNDGSLHMHGWFFKMSTGDMYAYDPATHQFLLINRE